MLFVLGDQSDLVKRMGDELAETKLRSIYRNLTFATVNDAGHMMHHERPDEVAALIEEFLETK